jgi:hypothetical protein
MSPRLLRDKTRILSFTTKITWANSLAAKARNNMDITIAMTDGELPGSERAARRLLKTSIAETRNPAERATADVAGVNSHGE